MANLGRPSSLGWRTANFAATAGESRGKFAGAYNPSTLRNIKERKILPLSRNKLLICAVKKVCFPHVFRRDSSGIIDNIAFYRAP